jgi:hypothetical protein
MAVADHTRLGAEEQLRLAIATGTLVDLRTGQAEADNPARGATWDHPRTVRASLLAELLIQPGEEKQRPRGLRLAGARITGTLNLEGTELVCPLLLHDCWFDEPVTIGDVQAVTIRLPGCHLPALYAKQVRTRGDLDLDEGFSVHGEVLLRGARIGGALSLDRATLTNPNGDALNAGNLTVDQSMQCEGLTSDGAVALFGARIGGALSFTRATLTNPDGDALLAAGLTVGYDMRCEELTADGTVDLTGAHIGGALSFTRATLSKPDGRALDADNITVDQGMYCRSGFTAHGEVNLRGARIGGQLSFVRATLDHPGRTALRLQEFEADALFLALTAPPSEIDFLQGRVGTLYDDPSTWPKTLRLVGFSYDALHEVGLVSGEEQQYEYDALEEVPTVSARQRLRWLRRDPAGYTPQPYEQLAAVYRRAGREEDARRVAIAKQRQRRRVLSPPARLWSLLLGALVGHGYRTWFAAGWLLGWLAVGTLVYQRAYPAQMPPAKPGEPTPAFEPMIYALDVLLPVVNLEQQAHWIPQGFARSWTWASILAGWVLTTVVVAALTGLLKRE